MQHKYDLIVIGHVSYDENRTRYGIKTVPSGGVYLVALPASLYSKRIGLVTRVGEDFDMRLLERLNIDLSGVHIIKNGKTSRFYHNYLSEDGSMREFKAELNVGSGLIPEDIPASYFDSRCIHIATMPPHQQRKFVKYLRPRSSAMLSVDTLEQYVKKWQQEIIDIFLMADLIFVDRREHNLIRGLEGKDIIIKKGSEGAEYRHGGEIIKVPAPRVTVVDKTGAGDVLAGVFLILRARGKDPEAALKEAVKLASESITQFGIDFLLKK